MCHEGEITKALTTQEETTVLKESPVNYSDCIFTYKVLAAALRALAAPFLAIRGSFLHLEAISGTLRVFAALRGLFLSTNGLNGNRDA